MNNRPTMNENKGEFGSQSTFSNDYLFPLISECISTASILFYKKE